MTSVMDYLNAPGKRLGRKEGNMCVYSYICVSACPVTCQKDVNRWQAADLILLLISALPMCPLHTSLCVLCIHTSVGACVQYMYQHVCVWMKVPWCEDMSSSLWNVEFKEASSNSVAFMAHSLQVFHTILSLYFITAMHSWILYLYFFLCVK